MQQLKTEKDKTANQSRAVWSRAVLSAASVIVILAGVRTAADFVVNVLLALFIAIVCAPLIRWQTERKVPHWLAVSALFALVFAVISVLFGMVRAAARTFVASAPYYRELLTQRMGSLQEMLSRFNLPLEFSPTMLNEYLDPSAIMGSASGLLMGITDIAGNTFIVLMLVVFMLFEAQNGIHRLSLAFSRNSADAVRQEEHIRRILNGIIRYLGLKTLMSLMTGVLIYILLRLCGVQYAILWGTLAFLLNYIPNIGSIVAAVPMILQALVLNGMDVGAAVAIGVFTVNMVIGNVVEPKLMGRTLGLSTLVVFLSLLFWGWLLGKVGMLLSVPLTMAVKIVLESGANTRRYAALLGDVEETALHNAEVVVLPETDEATTQTISTETAEHNPTENI